jgi:hypothetical protein
MEGRASVSVVIARSARRLEDVSLMVCCKDGAQRLFGGNHLEGLSASAKSVLCRQLEVRKECAVFWQEYRSGILTRRETEGRERRDLREYNPWLNGRNGRAGWKIAHANVRRLSFEEVGRLGRPSYGLFTPSPAAWLEKVAPYLAQLARVAGRASFGCEHLLQTHALLPLLRVPDPRITPTMRSNRPT